MSLPRLPSVGTEMSHSSHISCDIFDGCTLEALLQVPTPEQEHESHRYSKRLRRRQDEALELDATSPDQYQTAANKSQSSVIAALAGQLTTWVQSLSNYHYKCKSIPTQSVVRVALAILREHVKTLNASGINSFLPHTFHSLTAAALWIAIKFIGPRAAVPGASFMSLAVAVENTYLKEAELHLMQSIDWNVYAITKKVLPCITNDGRRRHLADMDDHGPTTSTF